MKKLLSALLAICMVCMFAVPVFADANDDYIAAVKAYQQEIAAKEAAYTAAVNAYSKQAKAKADADSAGQGRCRVSGRDRRRQGRSV